jgi:peroxiredoxin
MIAMPETHKKIRSLDLASLGIIGFFLKWRGPDFTLPDLEGRTVSLSSLRGKIVLLNFWTSWCEACCLEGRSLEELCQAFRQEAFSLLAVNIGEPAVKVERFCQAHRISLQVLLDRSGKVSDAYGVLGIPSTYILDREGLVIGRATGIRDWVSEPGRHLIRELLDRAASG